MIVKTRRLDLFHPFSLNFKTSAILIPAFIISKFTEYLNILMMLSNRRLIYDKVYVDSQKRLPHSESSSDVIM